MNSRPNTSQEKNQPTKVQEKKQCYFSQNNIKYIDYKDVDLLKKFLNPHARLQGSLRTGVSAKSQRQLAMAVKRARFMGLLPYVSR